VRVAALVLLLSDALPACRCGTVALVGPHTCVWCGSTNLVRRAELDIIQGMATGALEGA